MPLQNDLSKMDEDYLYPGIENRLSIANYVVLKLGCKFDLDWYPFDTQKCPIIFRRPNEFHNQFRMKWLKRQPPMIKEDIKLVQYEVLPYLEYDHGTSPSIKLEVNVIFCRKFNQLLLHSLKVP